ncbi:hypothetical protein D3C83_123520 [compost metagenome]
MSKEYEVCGKSREDMVFGKQRLYEIGGVRAAGVKKWRNADDEAAAARKGGH